MRNKKHKPQNTNQLFINHPDFRPQYGRRSRHKEILALNNFYNITLK